MRGRLEQSQERTASVCSSSSPQNFLCAQEGSARNMRKHCQSCPKFKLPHQFNSHHITKITHSHIQNNCLGNRSKCLLSHVSFVDELLSCSCPCRWLYLKESSYCNTFTPFVFFFPASKCCGQFSTPLVLSFWLILGSSVLMVMCSQVEKLQYPLLEVLNIKGRGSKCWIMKMVQRCNGKKFY